MRLNRIVDVVKILFVDLGSVWGGQEIYSSILSRALAKNNYSITFFSPHQRHNIPGLKHIKCSIKYINFLHTALHVYLISKNYDLIHFNGNRSIYLSSIIPRTKPFLGTKHSQFQNSLKGKVAKFAFKFLIHNLNWLICVSDGVFEQITKASAKKISIVRNGVEDTGGLHFDLSAVDILSICYVGRFVETKGLLRLLKAAHILSCKGIQYRLLLAGSGPLLDCMLSFIAEHNLSAFIEIIGYIEDPSEIFQRSHICVLPSTYEGLPLSLLEASASGCALIGHDVNGVRNIIKHLFNGIFSEITPEGLAQSIELLNYDRKLLISLRKNARSDYECNWRLDRMVKETIIIYNKILRGH